MSGLRALLQEGMARQELPGLSFASLRAGQIDEVHALGVRNAPGGSPVDGHTVFEAASLTKPVVSFIALQLVQEGLLELHRPLHDICGEYVKDDERARAITALHVLTHTSGLPNIVREDAPLRTHFTPGERFSYGSSAFAWLQRAMEAVAGQALEPMAQERVFGPLGMHDSSLQWQPRFEANHATGQDWDGTPVPKRRLERAQASWSLLTTGGDYARFVQAALQGRGLGAAMRELWFAPAVQPRQGGEAEDLRGEHPVDEDMAWGAGWGLEPAQQCFFHWGNSPGFRALVVASRASGDGVVWFANAARGLRIAHEVLPATVPGEHPLVNWMQIGR